MGNWQYEGSEEILAKYEPDWKKVFSSLFTWSLYLNVKNFA